MYSGFMTKEEIVRELLRKGIIVTPETLEKIEKQGMTAIDGETDAIAQSAPAGAAKKRITCRIKGVKLSREITVDDVVNINVQRYEAVRRMLLRKTSAVSINNIGRTNAKITVIGMVSETAEGGFVIQDTTGILHVRSTTRPDIHDVIAVSGWMRNGILVGEEISYPDIPLDREINTMTGKVLLTYERGSHEQNADVVITEDSLIEQGQERMITNPAWLFLENGTGKAVIFVYKTDNPVEKEDAVKMLKRRHIVRKETAIPNSAMVFETIPDIIWFISRNPPWVENYKGVSIISMPKGHNALINLKTRKVEMS